MIHRWGRSPGARKWQPTPVFSPGEFYGHSPTGLTLTLSLSFIVPVDRWLKQVLEREELAPVTQLVTRGWEGRGGQMFT